VIAAARTRRGALREAAPPALLFASGIAALVYQVVWIKRLGLIVGVDVFAVSLGVGAFFLGLALGGWWLGRLADRTSRPLLLYAALEMAVAVLGVGATQALAASAGPFAVLEMAVGPLAWLLPLVLVGGPAIAMGGTLPALLVAQRSMQTGADVRLGHAGGRLYAANTLGAVVGALVAAFVLIPGLGVQGAAYAAGTVNVLLALGALGVDMASRPRPVITAGGMTAPRTPPAGARLAARLYALAGGIAMGYEVVWTQVIVPFTSTRSFAFATVLATYLAGLMIGSALYARRADRARDPWGSFALLIALAGLLALVQVAALGGWLPAAQARLGDSVEAVTGSRLAAVCAGFALASACVVLGPTLLLGAAFPAALRLAACPESPGRDTGRVLALNTAGGIVGTFVAGFVLVPLLGLVRSLGALAIAASVVGLLALRRGRRDAGIAGDSPGAARTRMAVGAIAGAAVLVAALTPANHLARLLTQTRGGTLVAYEESAGGTVAVVSQREGEQRFRRLYIQGVSNSGDTMASLRYMRLQGLLPLIVHPGEPRSALVIALGTGITAGALARYPGLERHVVAELLPAVLRAVPRFEGNYGVATDPRIDFRLRDGRRELMGSAQRYDVITLEPPPPSAAGVANLYSRDFYRLARARLQPGGVFAQWLPIATQNDEDTRSLVRSFLDVFPDASLWTTELHEMLLVGSTAPIPLDAARIEARMQQPAVAAALAEVGITGAAGLLATWITDAEGLSRYVADAPPVTDDRPRIEYAAWVRPGELTRVLPKLLALRKEVPVQGGGPALLAQLARERETLLTFYDAGLAAYDRDEARWRAATQRMADQVPGNAYYRRLLDR
jgi:spermidine synthase